MEQRFALTFANGHEAYAIRVQDPADLPAALRALGLQPPRGNVVLVGGAQGMTADELARLRPLFAGALRPVAQALDLAVIDGGTDAGVMRLMGQEHAGARAAFPLIGVAAWGTVALPQMAPLRDAAPLEPHHTHFVLVPGSHWGDESPWLADVAAALAGDAPSLTVLVNGGEISLQDVAESVAASRPVIAVSGSGRVADALAGAAQGSNVDTLVGRLAASGLIRAINLDDGAQALAESMRALCSREA